MKKSIIIAAAAILAIGMTACEPEAVNPINNNVNNGTATTPRVKSTADLHNTNWTYTVTYTEFLNNLLGTNIPCTDSINDETYEFGLNFDGTYAHFTFPTNIEAYGGGEGELSQISGVSYTYSYDGTTHTGYLDGVAEDEDGNDVPAQLQFTYDDNTDAITFNLPMFFAEDGTPFTLTMVFQRDAE